MLLRAKIGTLSLQVVKTVRLRRSPNLDQVFWVHERLDPTHKPFPGSKPIRVLCRGIVGIGPDAIWLLERW